MVLHNGLDMSHEAAKAETSLDIDRAVPYYSLSTMHC